MSEIEACTIYKRTVSKPRKSPTKVENNIFKNVDKRTSKFHSTWEKVQTEAENIQHNLFLGVLTELTSYLKSLQILYDQNHLFVDIPCASLITGVNIPDHEGMFQTLKDLITEMVSETVVFVSSNEADSSKSIIRKIVEELLKFSSVSINSSNPKKFLEKLFNVYDEDIKFDKCSIRTIKDWYTANNSNGKIILSPSKRVKKSKDWSNKAKPLKKPIVIVFEDFESFLPKGVEDFIQMIKNYIDELPIVLVFCISTCGATISEMLSQTTLSSLSIKTFSSQNPTVQLGAVLEEILINSNYYFRLGSTVYKFLNDYFLFSDFSLKSFLSAFKMSMFLHFYTNPLSALCCDSDSGSNIVNSLNRSDIEQLRELHFSNSSITNKLEKKELKMLLTDDSYFKKYVVNSLKKLHKLHDSYFTILKFFWEISKNMPNLPFGNKLHQLYLLCLEDEIVQSEEFKDFLKLFRLMSREELLARLNDGLSVLKKENYDSKYFDPLEKYLEELGNLSEEKAPKSENTSICTGKKVDLTTLQKNLKEMKQSKKQSSPFEIIRSQIVDYLDEFIGQGLKHYKSFAFYEVFYFDNLKTLKQNFIGNFNCALKSALAFPKTYLKCKCCKSESNDGVISTFPDIVIAYKLLEEGGLLINLFDWMQSFAAIVDVDNSENLEKKKLNKKLKLIVARFSRSIDELHYLGLIKKTHHKEDHVARIFW